LFTANLVINIEDYATDGRSTTLECGKPGSGTLLRADCANETTGTLATSTKQAPRAFVPILALAAREDP
jgi:hypothetical protein